jgi:hypothetical protein
MRREEQDWGPAAALEQYDGSEMAAGDVRFPEMIERLRSQWHRGISFEATVELGDDLNGKLQQIRPNGASALRHLKCAVWHVGEGAEPHVSVRAMILSLTRLGIASDKDICS